MDEKDRESENKNESIRELKLKIQIYESREKRRELEQGLVLRPLDPSMIRHGEEGYALPDKYAYRERVTTETETGMETGRDTGSVSFSPPTLPSPPALDSGLVHSGAMAPGKGSYQEIISFSSSEDGAQRSPLQTHPNAKARAPTQHVVAHKYWRTGGGPSRETLDLPPGRGPVPQTVPTPLAQKEGAKRNSSHLLHQTDSAAKGKARAGPITYGAFSRSSKTGGPTKSVISTGLSSPGNRKADGNRCSMTTGITTGTARSSSIVQPTEIRAHDARSDLAGPSGSGPETSKQMHKGVPRPSPDSSDDETTRATATATAPSKARPKPTAKPEKYRFSMYDGPKPSPLSTKNIHRLLDEGLAQYGLELDNLHRLSSWWKLFKVRNNHALSPAQCHFHQMAVGSWWTNLQRKLQDQKAFPELQLPQDKRKEYRAVIGTIRGVQTRHINKLAEELRQARQVPPPENSEWHL